jgi:O-antigen ligase
LDIWTFAVERIAEHPLVGIGYGKETSKMLFGQVPEENLPSGHAPVRKHGTHNILLEVALLVGIPGLLLFVWLAVCIVRMVVGGFRLATDTFARATLLGLSVSVIGLAVRIQFDQMLVGTLAIQFWVLLAVAVLACGAAGAPSPTEQPSG